jgi:LysR family glycine cleavage system transcriptional activator
MRLSHLNGLRALEATLRNGNFRQAARELGVTPAAVSQRVANLEAYVGRKLFTRAPTGAEPTRLARKYADTLTTSLRGLSEVLEGLTDAQARNRIAVSMTQTFAEAWLLPRLSSFYKVGTEIDFRIDTTDRVVDLRTEDFDYGLRYSLPPGDDYRDIELFSGYCIPLCAPAFAEKYDLSPKTRSLRDVPLIHIQDPTSDPDWIDLTGWAQRFELESEGIERGLRFSHAVFGIQAAVAGRGLVLAGAADAPDAILSGDLINPFGPEFVLVLQYKHRLISLADKPRHGLHGSFEDWIEAEAQGFRTEIEQIVGC